MKNTLTVVLLVVCFVGCAGLREALAQTDTFMLVPGIKGSSVDDRHKDWIDVASLTQTLETTKKNPQCSLEVMKPLDIAGPLL